MAAVIGGISVYLEDDSARFQNSMRQNATLVEQHSQRMSRALGGTARSVDELNRKAQGFQPDAFRALAISALRAQTSVERLRNSMFAVAALAGGGFAGAFSAKVLIDTADQYTNITNRINAVVKGNQARIQTERQIFDIAQRTRTTLDSTAQLFQRLTMSRDVVKGTNEQILQMVETTQKAVIAAGSTQSEAASVATQLSQALGAGRLQGDELRSLLENAPILVDAIAKEFGVARGELKKMGADGLLVSDRVFKAILNAGKEVNDTFAEIQPTVRGALTVLDNAFTRYIGQVDQTLGASAALATGIMGIANNLSSFGDILLWVSPLLAGFLAQRAASSFGRTISAPFMDARARALEAVNAARSAEQAAAERVVNTGMAAQDVRRRARTNIESFADPLHVADRKAIARELARANADLEAAEADYRKIADKFDETDRQLASRDVSKMINGQAFTPFRQAIRDATREVTQAESALNNLGGERALKSQVDLQNRINASLEKEEEIRRKIHNVAFQERQRLSDDVSDPSQMRVTNFTHQREVLERQLARTLQERAELEGKLSTEVQGHAEKQVQATTRLTAARQALADAEKNLATQVARTQAQQTQSRLGGIAGQLGAADASRAAAAERVRELQTLNNENEAALRTQAHANATAELSSVQQRAVIEARGLEAAQRNLAAAAEAATVRQMAMASALAGLRNAGAGLVAFLGGPWGVAFTGAIAGLGLFQLAQAKAAASTAEFKQNVEAAVQAIERMNEARAKGTALSATDILQERARSLSLARGLRGEGQDVVKGTSSLLNNPWNAIRATGDTAGPRQAIEQALQQINQAGTDSAKAEKGFRALIESLLDLSAVRPDLQPLTNDLVQQALAAERAAKAQQDHNKALRENPSTLSDALAGKFDTSPRERELARQAALVRQAEEISKIAAAATDGYTPDGLAAASEITRGLHQLEQITQRIREEPAISAEWVSAEVSKTLRDINQQALDLMATMGNMPSAQEQIAGEIAVWANQLRALGEAYDTAGAAEEAMTRGFRQSGEELTQSIINEAGNARAALEEHLSKLDTSLLDDALRTVGSSLEEVKKNIDKSATSADAAKAAQADLTAAMQQLSAQGLDFSQPIAALKQLMQAFALTAGMAQNLRGTLPGSTANIPNPTLGVSHENAEGIALQDPVIRALTGQGVIQRKIAESEMSKTAKRVKDLKTDLIADVLAAGGSVPHDLDLDKAADRIIAGEDARRAEGRKPRKPRVSQEAREAEKFTERLERIIEESRAGFFTDIDRQVVEELKKIKGDPKLMRDTVDAMQSGGALPAQAQALKDAMIAREAGQEYQGLIREYGTGEQLAGQFAEKQAILNSLVDGGKISADQAAVAYADYLGQFRQFQYIDDLANAFEGFGQTIADALFEGELSMETFAKAGRQLAKEIFNIGIQIAVLEPLKNLLRGGLSSSATGGGFNPLSFITSIFGGGTAAVNHAGGVASALGGARSIPNWMLGSAPRFHSGLRANELVSVLENDEVVLNRKQQARAMGLVNSLASMPGGGGGASIEVINQNGSQISVEKKRGADGRMTARVLVTNMILEDISQNGDIAQALQGLYGVDRMGAR